MKQCKVLGYRIIYLLMLIPVLLPKVTMAEGDASPIDFTPPESDVSIRILGYIFGIVDGVLSGSGSQIVGEMFGIFNSAVIVLGSIAIMYTVMISITNTAGEGTMMGKQWSSVWVPVRSVVGVALLIPKASGYCTIQIIVMWVAIQGVGAADAIWGQALTYLQRGGVLIDSSVPQTPTPGQNLQEQCNYYRNVDPSYPIANNLRALEDECKRSVAELTSTTDIAPDVSDKKAATADMLRALICMHSLERVLGNRRTELLAVSNTSVEPVPAFSNYLTTIKPDGKVKTELLIPPVVTEGGGTGAYTDFAGVCGKINITAITNDDIRAVQEKFQNLPNISNADGTPNYNHPIISATAKARGIAVQQMINELSSTAFRIVNNVYYDSASSSVKYNAELGYWITQNEFKDWVGNASRTAFPLMSGYELVNAVNAYVALMRPTLRLLQDKTGDIDFIEQARASGWILAGSYFFNIVKATEDAKGATFQRNSVQATYHFNRNDLTRSTGSCVKVPEGANKPCEINYFRNGEPQKATLTLDNFNASASPLGYCNYWSKPCGGSGADQVERYIEAALQSQETTGASQESGSALMFELAEVPKKSGSVFSCGFFLDDIIGCVAYFLDIAIFTPITNALIGMVNWVVVPAFSAVMFEPIRASGYLFNASVKASYEPGKNPILELAKFGNLLMSMAVNMVFGLIVWGIITVLFPGPLFIVAIPIFLIIAPVVMVFVGTIWGAGLMMAFYVPLIPYVIFTFAAIAWLISVIEAMVAAPIIALGLAHPEGQTEELGRAEASVLLLANVFLRPSLMIIGFVIAMILTYVVVILFNVGFVRVNEMVLDIAKGQGFGEFMAPIFMMLFYVRFYMQLIEKCFDLIYILPDQVLMWIGGGDDIGRRSAGDIGGAMKQEIEKVDQAGKKVGGGVIRGVKNVARVGAAAATKGKSETSGAAQKADDATATGDSK